jgi:peptide/nickel transport system permease protein
MIDYRATMVALWGLSIPNCWFGILLILLFSVELGLLPASDFVSQVPVFVRLTRGQVPSVKHEEYVEAAHAIGNSARRIVLRHILPISSRRCSSRRHWRPAAAIVTEASVSFLGLGQQPPNPSWGSMLNTAKNFLQQAPWMAIWPGLAISGLVLSLNLFGDCLRDALDPRGAS